MAMNPQNVLSSLRMMDDQALQQYAAMHKNDPFIFPLAFQESQTRKQMRAETQAMQPPQPKVADQALAQMAPQPRQPLPEDVGIGALPADNLKSMATGGIVAFDVQGGKEAAWKVIDSTRICSITANLGDTKTTITHPATTTHGRLTPEQRAEAGISDGLIRVAVGLENINDLRADLARGFG